MMYDYTYARSSVNVPELSSEIKGAIGKPPNILDWSGTQVTASFDIELSTGDEATLASIVVAHDKEGLLIAKQKKMAAIDKKTSEVIEFGFEFPPSSGYYFSLSMPSQAKLLAIDSLRDDIDFTYPVIYNTVDDLAQYSIPDADVAHSFVKQAVGTYRAQLDYGTGLKDQVRNATTVAAVDAIVDPR